MNLKNKVILITGAGTGLGKALALVAGQAGAKVICAGRRKDKIQHTADEVSKAGGMGTAVEMDVTDLIGGDRGVVGREGWADRCFDQQRGNHHRDESGTGSTRRGVG